MDVDFICDWNAERQVIDSARRSGKSFKDELEYLIKMRRISRPIGLALSFGDAHQRGLDIKRSAFALGQYARNDFVYKEKLVMRRRKRC